MSKRRTENYKKHVGQVPGALVYTGQKTNKKLHIESFDYHKDKVEETVIINIQDAIPYKDTTSVTWINVNGLHYTEEIEQIGKLIIGKNVEIGANCSIDRGALSNTEIHDGVKLDNQIQVAHNVIIGKDSAIAASCAIAGSTVIGKNFKMGGLSGVLGHIVNTSQRPKIDEYDDYIFIVLKMLHYDKNENVSIEQVSLVLGKNYVLSFQEAEGDVFDTIRNRLRYNKGRIRSLKSDYLMYTLIDAVVDNYFSIIEILGNKIEDLETELFSGQARDGVNIEVQQLKREILKVRRAIFPLRDIISRIEKGEHPLVLKRTITYYRDIYDHLIQVAENIDIYREMIWSLMDMYMTTISNKMNEVMKVLTIIATIFIPLTFIAGIYGMNFEYIPELHYKYSYFILWGIMIVLFIAMLLYFRKKKWL